MKKCRWCGRHSNDHHFYLRDFCTWLCFCHWRNVQLSSNQLSVAPLEKILDIMEEDAWLSFMDQEKRPGVTEKR